MEFSSLEQYGVLNESIMVTGQPKPIFPRLDSEAEIAYIKESCNRLLLKRKEEIPSKPQIDIKDFDKVEIKAATIIDAEHVKKSDKLLKIQVDYSEQRQIVSGIAKLIHEMILLVKK